MPEPRRAVEAAIRAEPIDSATAQACLARYLDELAERIPATVALQEPESAELEGLSPPDGRFFVAWIDEAPVGCGGVRLLEPDRAEIKRMWVDGNHRGRGIGASMLGALEREAGRLGATAIVLDTNAVLLEAQALYRRHGYGEIAAYNRNPHAHHWFAKVLP